MPTADNETSAPAVKEAPGLQPLQKLVLLLPATNYAPELPRNGLAPNIGLNLPSGTLVRMLGKGGRSCNMSARWFPPALLGLATADAVTSSCLRPCVCCCLLPSPPSEERRELVLECGLLSLPPWPVLAGSPRPVGLLPLALLALPAPSR